MSDSIDNGLKRFECDGKRFIPVSVAALSFLRSPELIRTALGRLSPHMLGTLGFSADEAKAIEYLYCIAESFMFSTTPSVDFVDARRFRWLRDRATECTMEPSPVVVLMQGPANRIVRILQGDDLEQEADRAMGEAHE